MVLYVDANVSEKHAVSIFRAELTRQGSTGLIAGIRLLITWSTGLLEELTVAHLVRYLHLS
jgi:hypothetical protein